MKIEAMEEVIICIMEMKEEIEPALAIIHRVIKEITVHLKNETETIIESDEK